MKHTLQHTGILVFARTADAEAKEKRLSRSQASDCKIAQALLDHSLQVARKTGLPVMHVTESEQSGANFGERLQNAMQSVFTLGFERVVVIGGDCAHLSPQLILDAGRTDASVLGPTLDGGIYLMGITRSAFDGVDFSLVDWQSNSVFEQLHFQLYHEGVEFLSPLCDIDRAEDLEHVVRLGGLPVQLWTELASIAFSQTSYERPESEAAGPIDQFQFLSHRGPPAEA